MTLAQDLLQTAVILPLQRLKGRQIGGVKAALFQLAQLLGQRVVDLKGDVAFHKRLQLRHGTCRLWHRVPCRLPRRQVLLHQAEQHRLLVG